MVDHEIENNLQDDFQSAYHEFQSTETVLLRFRNDRFGIQGDALEWTHSYLLNHEQFVYINGKSSRKLPLSQEVPQLLVSGPFLFCTYLTPIREIFHNHGVSCQIYADDSTLYIALTANNQSELNAAISECQLCARDIVNWTVEN